MSTCSFIPVANVYGATNYVGAIDHYITWGLAEGRQASSLFNVRRYLIVNPDLQGALGATNYPAAALHYVLYGVNEGRRSSGGFFINAYLARYPDLQAAFGNDKKSAVARWIQYGAREGRNPSP